MCDFASFEIGRKIGEAGSDKLGLQLQYGLKEVEFLLKLEHNFFKSILRIGGFIGE